MTYTENVSGFSKPKLSCKAVQTSPAELRQPCGNRHTRELGNALLQVEEALAPALLLHEAAERDWSHIHKGYSHSSFANAIVPTPTTQGQPTCSSNTRRGLESRYFAVITRHS
eukprot:4630393-Amphidinium_carterae.1